VTPSHHTPSSVNDSEIFGPALRRHPRNQSVDEGVGFGGSVSFSGNDHPLHSRIPSVSDRVSIDQQTPSLEAHGHRRTNRNYKEFDEFSLREDLKSWSVDPRHVQETISSALLA